MRKTLLFILLLLFPWSTYGAEISLNLDVVAVNDTVTVTVKNTGRDSAPNTKIQVELNGVIYREALSSPLKAEEIIKKEFTVQLPEIPGTYPLITTIFYENSRKEMSLVDVGIFNFQETRLLETGCGLKDFIIYTEYKLTIDCKSKIPPKLIFPRELSLKKIESDDNSHIFHLNRVYPELASTFPVFLIYEKIGPDGVHATEIIKAKARTRASKKSPPLLPPITYLLMALGGLYLAYKNYLRSSEKELREHAIATARWAFSISVISILYLLFYNLHTITDIFFELIRTSTAGVISHPYYESVVSSIFNWFHFDGKNYDNFSKYIATPLYLYMIFGNYFVIRYLIKPNPEEDKYWHFMLTVFSAIPFIKQDVRAREKSNGLIWSRLSKIAILTLMVKAFYLPLLTSWTISNISHQYNLTQSFQWTFEAINIYLVAALILIDVSIFAVGYMTELPQLKNKIRSVEPTLLGWVVCIMCYPPFNTFSFVPFDHALFEAPLVNKGEPYGETVMMIGTVIITLSWAVYTWATVALGFKSSNLTNRGIVSHGPYRFIRHPAYVSKVFLWIVSGAILSHFNFFLLLAFFIIYTVRAWTEERHLSQDPDYIEYKKKVPWRAIPGIF